MKVKVIPILNDAIIMIAKGFVGGLEDIEIIERARTIKTTPFL